MCFSVMLSTDLVKFESMPLCMCVSVHLLTHMHCVCVCVYVCIPYLFLILIKRTDPEMSSPADVIQDPVSQVQVYWPECWVYPHMFTITHWQLFHVCVCVSPVFVAWLPVCVARSLARGKGWVG